MQMDIQVRIRSITSHRFCSRNHRSSSSSSSYSPSKSFCSRRDSQESQQNGDNKNKGDKFSTDWDKAWSTFRKQGRKTLFSQFSADKYVSWNPRRSDFPLSEVVDPIKRTERSNLILWTSPGFTLNNPSTVYQLVMTLMRVRREELRTLKRLVSRGCE